jgi:hypothetical protein
MIQLIYSSNAVQPFSPEALRKLLVSARTRNTTAGISGMLLHVDGAFLQILEGDAKRVRALFSRIGGDARHHKVVLLLEREIATRNFPDWSMGFFDGSGHSAALTGYRKTAGFADLLGDTARITRVVADFRDGRWRSLAV